MSKYNHSHGNIGKLFFIAGIKRRGSVKMGIIGNLVKKMIYGPEITPEDYYPYQRGTDKKEEDVRATSDRIIGIDLGTSNSSAAVWDVKSQRVLTIPNSGNFPSCVAFRDDGRIL